MLVGRLDDPRHHVGPAAVLHVHQIHVSGADDGGVEFAVRLVADVRPPALAPGAAGEQQGHALQPVGQLPRGGRDGGGVGQGREVVDAPLGHVGAHVEEGVHLAPELFRGGSGERRDDLGRPLPDGHPAHRDGLDRLACHASPSPRAPRRPGVRRSWSVHHRVRSRTAPPHPVSPWAGTGNAASRDAPVAAGRRNMEAITAAPGEPDRVRAEQTSEPPAESGHGRPPPGRCRASPVRAVRGTSAATGGAPNTASGAGTVSTPSAGASSPSTRSGPIPGPRPRSSGRHRGRSGETAHDTNTPARSMEIMWRVSQISRGDATVTTEAPRRRGSASQTPAALPFPPSNAHNFPQFPSPSTRRRLLFPGARTTLRHPCAPWNTTPHPPRRHRRNGSAPAEQPIRLIAKPTRPCRGGLISYTTTTTEKCVTHLEYSPQNG